MDALNACILRSSSTWLIMASAVSDLIGLFLVATVVSAIVGALVWEGDDTGEMDVCFFVRTDWAAITGGAIVLLGAMDLNL